MLRRGLASLDLNLLALRLRLREGDAWRGSELAAAVERLQALSGAVESRRAVAPAAWERLEGDLSALAAAVQRRQQLEQQLELNAQRYQRELFARLAAARGGGGGEQHEPGGAAAAAADAAAAAAAAAGG